MTDIHAALVPANKDDHGNLTTAAYRDRTIAQHRAVADLFERHPELHPEFTGYDVWDGTVTGLEATSAAHLRFLLSQMDTVEVNEQMSNSTYGSGKIWLNCTVDGYKVSVTGDWETIDPPQPPEQTIAERRAALIASLTTPALDGGEQS